MKSWLCCYFISVAFAILVIIVIHNYIGYDLGDILSLTYSFVIMLTGFFTFLFAITTFDKFGIEKSKI